MPEIGKVNREDAATESRDLAGAATRKRHRQGMRLHNRSTGVVAKKGNLPTELIPKFQVEVKKDFIIEDLRYLAIPIDSVTPDPMNARLHPERNLEAIKESLCLYGQRKPIVVNRRTKIVEAGNGTLESAKLLGWTKIAAVWTDDDPGHAAGYGIADNRTAELAKWDFKVLKALDKLVVEEGLPTTGWNDPELVIIRVTEWVRPEIDETEAPGKNRRPIKPDERQRLAFDRACAVLRQRDDSLYDDGEVLRIVCEEWTALQSGEGE